MESPLKVRHVYEHDAHDFELRVNAVIGEILAVGGAIGDVQYVNDPATDQNQRGGFGALIIYETADADDE